MDTPQQLFGPVTVGRFILVSAPVEVYGIMATFKKTFVELSLQETALFKLLSDTSPQVRQRRTCVISDGFRFQFCHQFKVNNNEKMNINDN